MHYDGIITQTCQGICQHSRVERVDERGWTMSVSLNLSFQGPLPPSVSSRTDYSKGGLEGIRGYFWMGLILLWWMDLKVTMALATKASLLPL